MMMNGAERERLLSSLGTQREAERLMGKQSRSSDVLTEEEVQSQWWKEMYAAMERAWMERCEEYRAVGRAGDDGC